MSKELSQQERLYMLADDIQMVGFADHPKDVVNLAKGYLALEARCAALEEQIVLAVGYLPQYGGATARKMLKAALDDNQGRVG